MSSDKSAQQISKNKAVQFTYTITDDEGNVIEQIDSPVSYVHGTHNMGLIERVERALEGCVTGDSVEVEVPPEESFGEYNPKLIFSDDLESVPKQFRNVGAQVEMTNENGESKIFIVEKIENGKLTLNGNHPLAGKTATFAVTILDVRDATDIEIREAMSNPDDSIH